MFSISSTEIKYKGSGPEAEKNRFYPRGKKTLGTNFKCVSFIAFNLVSVIHPGFSLEFSVQKF